MNATNNNPAGPRPPSHGRLVRKLVLVAVGMFGFGFAMWPLYNVFCDLTGLGGRGVKVADNAAGVQRSDRQIRIRFDADMFSLTDITNLLMRVGLQVGIGAGRPFSKDSCGMGWGLFDIVSEAKKKRGAA